MKFACCSSSKGYFTATVLLQVCSIFYGVNIRMPLSKQKTYARFNVGKYIKQAKTVRDNLSECNENIRKEKLKYEVGKAKLKRLQLKINETNANVATLQQGLGDENTEISCKDQFLSSISVSRRRKQPSNENMTIRTKVRRTKETYNAALEIHGVPYYKLVKYLNGLDIGNLYSVEEELCQNFNDTDNISGLFRDIKEFLPKLAEFYLKMYKSEDFNWFGQPYTFKVAIGGDGAPSGKHDQSCAWLISFLNIAGERSNSATYFSTFGTVSVADMANLNFSFGQAKNCEWNPWNYDKHLLVVKHVEALKKKLEKAKGSEKTKRAKITSLIAQMQSRQEFVPRIGRFIDRAHVELLHLKNNLCTLMHRKILEYAIGVSKLPQNVNVCKDVVPESPFARLIRQSQN
ncbi:Hypothetical predicted protein [Paramuricea clavata]|uniref:Uncharacterized protein n=1 Tax=Paramuricea clavata TaxID=317549 RepID=A0A7D9DI22_PARCT|nr:Hypothetical predicted protein [Paramuricea clavata]